MVNNISAAFVAAKELVEPTPYLHTHSVYCVILLKFHQVCYSTDKDFVSRIGYRRTSREEFAVRGAVTRRMAKCFSFHLFLCTKGPRIVIANGTGHEVHLQRSRNR